MKVVLSWIGDPCIHLIVIGLLLMRLMMGISPDSESEDLADLAPKCRICGTPHGSGMTCPTLVVKQVARPAAN
ncbi:MAG TPA: hypothetical protein VKP69_22330 [Isosphaeraceae bacterium]|nr:hypothetical protein [Isosphaeraceae bacterium]